MITTRSASKWMSAWMMSILLILSLMPQSSRADGSDPDYDDPLDQSNADATHSSSGSGDSMDNKTRELIIILSVVIGVVVLVSVGSSVIYIVAQRRQWNVREAIWQSARRVMNAIKSTFSKSPQAFPPPQRRRSSRGMTKLKSPRTAEMLATNQQKRQRPLQPDRFEEAHKMPWEEWGGGHHHNNNNKNFDLERGIELASTGNMKITVSTTADSSNSRSEAGSSKTGWGGFFALRRHKH